MMNVTSTPPKNTTVTSVLLDASASGATAIVAATPGRQIRVVSLAFVTTAANTVKLLSASTAITPGWPMAANGGMVLPYNDHGWCQTAVNEALNVNLSAATATGVLLQYIVI